jgi:type IV secretory pathway VirD2 relaxase
LILAGRYQDGIVVKNRFFKVNTSGGKKAIGQKLSSHFKYLEHRPKDEQQGKEAEKREDRYLFNAESDHINRKDAVHDVMEHTSHRAAYHHLILSPDPNEPVADLRAWTRNIMSDLAEAKGQDLHWYAVQHSNTDHAHVHVVIAGGAEVEGQEKREPVTIFNKDIDQLHESAFAHSDHELYQQLDQMHQVDLQELHQELALTLLYHDGPGR